MMTKKFFLFASIAIIYLSIISLVAPVNGLKVVYRNTDTLKSPEQQTAAKSNTENIHTADIISAPLSCPPDERLDLRKQCRKVNAKIVFFSR